MAEEREMPPDRERERDGDGSRAEKRDGANKRKREREREREREALLLETWNTWHTSRALFCDRTKNFTRPLSLCETCHKNHIAQLPLL